MSRRVRGFTQFVLSGECGSSGSPSPAPLCPCALLAHGVTLGVGAAGVGVAGSALAVAVVVADPVLASIFAPQQGPAGVNLRSVLVLRVVPASFAAFSAAVAAMLEALAAFPSRRQPLRLLSQILRCHSRSLQLPSLSSSSLSRACDRLLRGRGDSRAV